MANIKSILNSVEIWSGNVHFPSRYAAREVVDTLLEFSPYRSLNYRILSMEDDAGCVVYFPAYGCLLDRSDLDFLKDCLSEEGKEG